MNIRKAQLKETSIIADMAYSLLKHHEKLDPIWTPHRNARSSYQQLMRKTIYANNALLLVAEHEGKIIGFARAEVKNYPPVFKARRYGNISDVYVEKKYRRLGVAKAFLDEIFHYFKLQQLPYAELSVASKNEMGRNAWKKYGFKDVFIHQRKQL